MPDTVLPVTSETLLDAALWFSAFFWALFLGSIVLPGLTREGFRQPGGGTKTYKLSGLTLWVGTHVAVAAGTYFGGLSLTPLITHFWSLFIVINVYAVAWTVYLVVKGRVVEGDRIERAGRLPPLVHDAWFGTQLNPTMAGVDLKMFFYHPSLIGLALMNVAFAYAQYETYGTITLEMWLYQAFTWAYLTTHYVRESFMLSTWDIIAEKFGFMLVWGDLVYVPFLYSLVGWFVMDRGWTVTDGVATHEPYPLWAAGLLVAFHVLSHWVFRGSNWQKDRFKRDPKASIWGKPPETLDGRLLISGWWGIGRKINYTGEIGVYLSFALTAGLSSWVPYVLPLTLIILLTQRAGRDDKRCREKYGPLWDDYCARARFRLIPFLY